MSVTPDRAWGKLQRLIDGSLFAWHPLVDHCADVAAVLEALLRYSVLADRLFGPHGLPVRDERLIQRLGAIAFLHDIGKANRGFQDKRLLPPGVRHLKGIDTAGHVRELWPLLGDENELALRCRLSETLPVETLCGWVENEEFLPLLIAAVSHHGTPWNMNEPCRCATLWKAATSPDGVHYDPFDALGELGRSLRPSFPAAFEAGAPLLPGVASFQHTFAGLVMLADWLGSHTDFFPFRQPGDAPNRMAFARERARMAIEAVGLAVAARRAFVQASSPAFESIFAFAPNPMQTAAGRLGGGNLAILEAETGSGKTEAALWRFKQLFEVGAVDGLYFALPTRIAATQIHHRIQRAAARLWPDETARPGVLLAVPGYARIGDAELARILPGFEVLWTDNPGEDKAHERWAGENPKRFLAAQIAVGTVDQALLSNLMVRHAHLRSSALLRQLLVVDEVHASDPYMTALLRSVLKVHLDAGGHALLMSATLGSAARSAYLRGRAASPCGIGDAIAVPYPCLSTAERAEEKCLAFPASGREKQVRLDPRPVMDDPAALAAHALAAARSGAKVLVVRNTVGAAVATQQALEALVAADGGRREDRALLFQCEKIATLHHGRFAREDRKLLDKAVEARLGRERPAGGAIVIGTQTLEQSLDIDADLLIADLCPMDVLLQRIGRLHRHVRDDRPDGFARPVCVVAVPPERDLTRFISHRAYGLGSVYEELRSIEATWRLLETTPEIAIPAMNRELVERATHPEALAEVEALGQAWIELGQKIAGATAAQRGIAAIHGIDRNKPFGEWTFPGIDETIRTRLGAEDRLADFATAGLEPPMGPFGRRVYALTLPSHLCKGFAADAVLGALQPQEDGFKFKFDAKTFIYGRMGLAEAPAEF